MTGNRLIRATTAAVVTCVAAFAAVVSYSHIYDLGRAHGQSGTAARLLPLSVDGLILAGSLVLLHEARNRRPVPALARFALWLGIGSTIAANLAYGLPFGPLGAIVSAWPGAAFVIAVEMLMGQVRRARPDAPASAPATVIAAVATNAESAARGALAASITAGNPISQRQLASRFGISRTRAAALAREVAAEANGRSPTGATS
jgi:peptidoglycan/LPS O-acetylase OafA/YrhL